MYLYVEREERGGEGNGRWEGVERKKWEDLNTNNTGKCIQEALLPPLHVTHH